jgi:hypothetical protein
VAVKQLKPSPLTSLLSNEVIAFGTTKMCAELFDAKHIGVCRKTLTGNQPQLFGNVVSVWSGTGIGWDNKPAPILTVPVEGETPDGDMIIDLGDRHAGAPPYMVAYGTSDSNTAYCTAQVAGSSPPQAPITTQFSRVQVRSDSLLAYFTTLPRNAPRTYGNWIGLWKGGSLTYDGTNRIAKVDINSDAATSQSMNNLDLTVDTIYTLGYACGPRDQDLAAWLTFRTQPFLLSLLRSLFRVARPRA